MRSEFWDFFWLDANIWPIYVPVRILIIIELEVHAPADSLDHVVSSRGSTENQLLVGFLLCFIDGCGRVLFLSLDLVVGLFVDVFGRRWINHFNLFIWLISHGFKGVLDFLNTLTTCQLIRFKRSRPLLHWFRVLAPLNHVLLNTPHVGRAYSIQTALGLWSSHSLHW